MDRVDDILAQWQRERPDPDTGPMGILGRLKRLTNALSDETAAALAIHGLTPAGFDVLATLYRSGGERALTPSALIDWTMVSSGTMTNRIDRLVAQGLAERRVNPRDGRGYLIALTPKGATLIEEAIATHVAHQHRLLASLPPALRPGLEAALRAWLGAVERDAAPQPGTAKTDDAPGDQAIV